jgi:hypothetical protein
MVGMVRPPGLIAWLPPPSAGAAAPAGIALEYAVVMVAFSVAGCPAVAVEPRRTEPVEQFRPAAFFVELHGCISGSTSHARAGF